MAVTVLRATFIAVVLVLVLAPASAVAQGQAPPGNSAVDQYRESLPSPGTDRETPLTRTQREALKAQGADGERLADALRSQGGVPGTAPSPTTSDAPTTGDDKQQASSASERQTSKQSHRSSTAPDAGTASGTRTVPEGAGKRASLAGDSLLSTTILSVPLWVVLGVMAGAGALAVLRRRAA